jgi:SNF2 family DNA or RNA helicase
LHSATDVAQPVKKVGRSLFIIAITDFSRHLRPGAMTWRTYHGPVKPSIDGLSEYDIVLTTYETIAAQLKKFHKSNSVEETIYSVTWHRVILDEGT